MKFELLSGKHRDKSIKETKKGVKLLKVFKAGDIVESEKELDKVFENKFKRRMDLEDFEGKVEAAARKRKSDKIV